MTSTATSWMLGPETTNLVSALALVLSHGCAGACWCMVLLRARSLSNDPAAQGWLQRPARLLFMVSCGLALPALGTALLLLLVNDGAVVESTRQAFGPLVVLLLACPVLLVATWGGCLRCSRSRSLRVFEITAAATSFVGVSLGAAVVAFMFHPGEWLETRSLRELVVSPVVVLDLILRTGTAACLGGLALMMMACNRRSRTPPEYVEQLGSLCLVTALATTAFASAAWGAIAMGAFHDPWLGVAGTSGIHGGRAARMATVAITSGVCLSLALALHARARWTHLSAVGGATLLAIGIVSTGSWQEARRSSIRPWAIPGLLYANGTRIEQVRTERRTPLLDTTLRHSRDWLGAQMFARQCRSCHEHAGAFRQSLQDRAFPDTRALLEQLRDADQYGSAYRGVMPPLVGCDSEVDALAWWLCGQP
jgi:hypothetical protein